MKFYSLAVLFLVSEASAIKIEKTFLIGDQKVDFDDEDAFKEEKFENMESLAQADITAMQGFDNMLGQASRNSEMGELNIEMGKAQIEQLKV